MIIPLHETSQSDKDNKFRPRIDGDMAEQMFMFAVTAGIFAFLTAIVFASRAKRYSAGWTSSEGHAGANQE
jgi:hypothetical protein